MYSNQDSMLEAKSFRSPDLPSKSSSPKVSIPKIFNAIQVTSEGFEFPHQSISLPKSQQHIGEGRVRTIAMQPTDGLVRGMKAI